MVAKCCWRESKAEQPPPVIIEKSTAAPPTTASSSTSATFDPTQEKCRISLDSSFSNDSLCSSGTDAIKRIYCSDAIMLNEMGVPTVQIPRNGRFGGQ